MEVRLSPWQCKVWDSPSRFKVINVGRRSGKSVLCVLKSVEIACSGKKTVWYICPTYRQAKLIAWAILKEYVPGGASPVWNETELKCTLKNGSEICLKGADSPDSLRGTKIDFAVFDEVAFFAAWKQVWEVLRPILIDSKAPAWFVSTPNGFNHFHALYQLATTDAEYQSFHYTSYDNPYVDAEEIDKAKAQMDPRSFSQEFLADFNKPEGVVYQEWDLLTRYRKADYDPNLPLHVSFDWGINDPTCVLWIQPGNGEVRLIDYYEASDAAIEHFVSVIRSKPYKSPDLFTGDPAGKSRTLTTGTSVIDLLSRQGIHVRTKDGVRIPEQIRIAHSYMSRLFVDSERCERFRDCLLNYRYPTKPETAVNQENELPIHDEYSHAMRAFEYWAVNYGDFASVQGDFRIFTGGDSVTRMGTSQYRPQGDKLGYRTFIQ